MLSFLGFLLVVWVILILVGALVKGLLWLLAIGVILFVATIVWGWIKRDVLQSPRR